MTDGPLDNAEPAHKQLFMVYLELFRRRFSVHAMLNGYFGSELSETALLEVVNELTAKMKVDCKLTDGQDKALKATLIKLIFGARTKQWIKK